jgi:hypothetical protein
MPDKLHKARMLARDTAARWLRSPRLRWDLCLGLLVVTLLSYSWMFGTISVPNERSRVYLAVAIVDHGTLSIDEPVRRFGRIHDWARRDGRHYTDKAPGSSLLGAVPYAIVRCFTEPGDWKIHEIVNLMRTWVMLPIGLLGFFWLRRLLHRIGLDPPSVDITAIGWILGTSAFHYSTAFYGHQIVAVCMIGALDLALQAQDRLEEASSPRRAILPMVGAGMLAGMAGLTEYQAGIPAALLALFVVSGPARRHALPLVGFVLGAVPFALILFGYNTFAFGGPFELSYHYLIDPGLREVHGQGIGGVAAPRWDYAVGGLLSAHRGLLTTSPLFLLAVPGFVLMARRRMWRLTALVGVTLIYFLLFISSTKIWFAGWSFGPRLLVPVMGWTMIPVAFCVAALGRRSSSDGIPRGLALFGLLYHQAVHAVFPELPENATHPMVDVILPALRGDHVSPNLATSLFGWQGRSSLVPLAILVLIAGVVLMVRPREGRSRKARAGTVVATIGVLLLCSTPLVFAKPGWSAGEARRFTDWLAQLAEAERRLP